MTMNEKRFCATCKFCIPGVELSGSKCLLFKYINYESEKKRKNDLIEYLVTGIENKKDTQVNHYFCSTAREFPDMCGEEGKKWEEDVW